MIVVIDDERTFCTRGEETVYLRSSQEAFSILTYTALIFEESPAFGENNAISEMFFDHDLGDKSNDDGVTVARFVGILKRGCPMLFDGTRFWIHSQNPVGAVNIKNVLAIYDIKAEIVPLPALRKTIPPGRTERILKG